MPPTCTSPPDWTSPATVPVPSSVTAGEPCATPWPPAHTEPPTVVCALVATAALAAIDAAFMLTGPASLVESNELVVRAPETSNDVHAQAAKRNRCARSPVH